jgi:putative ABC transport system permease protein
MKNPLRKRLFRELKSEFGKYLVIFLLLTGTIGFVSGFLVADGSMMKAYQEGFEKYNIEDGHFQLESKANKAQQKTIRECGVSLYDLFYLDEPLTNNSTLRIYQNREQVNLACVMEGRLPEHTGEIAIDRMYADNNEIQVGDMLQSAEQSWVVTGLVALSDYSCLFSDNDDAMFDSVKFGVAVVSEEEFARFDENLLNFNYAWKYNNAPENESEEKEIAEDFMKEINGEVELSDFVPRYQNQAIQFTGEDMGSDKAMMLALLYIVIGIMAFVFGVTMSNTISKEANVIGTLRASGYTKRELICHYMTTPLFVTLLSALVGNVMGYTIWKGVCVKMYYGSYSLPTYVTIWNGEAFLQTTIVPMILMICINYVILRRTLSLSPLKFLRRDLSRKKQRRAVRLHPAIPFFSRFRCRILFQNLSSYCILFVGILFANLLLLFGLALPVVLDHYQEEIQNNMLCNYQYMLKVPYSVMNEKSKLKSLLEGMIFYASVETDQEDAEKFSAYSLNTLGDQCKSEEILLYGVEEDSKIISIDFSEDGVYISSAYADKYGVSAGDTIVLKEKYEDKTYSFLVDGIYDYMGGLTVFMEQKKLNSTFDLDRDYFSGYFSNEEITDINKKYIASVIDLEALTKISRQLDVSMGSMMLLVDGFSVIMFFVLIYLLSRMIIEKNAQSISMVKILGYNNIEISRLYIVSTTMVVICFLLLSLPIEYKIMSWIFRVMMMESMTGWIPFYVPGKIYVEMFLLGILAYGFVVVFEYKKIQKVPMDMALKNVE